MIFVYLDESKQDNRVFVYSALMVQSEHWNAAFQSVKQLRVWLRDDYGIYIKKELHASPFSAGKGEVSSRVLDRFQRSIIFREVLSFVGQNAYFKVMSSCNTNEFHAFDRIMNRINRFAQEHDSQALLVCDQGQEIQFTKRIRRMRVHNYVPSRYGMWDETRSPSRNIPTERIIEDPVFKDSRTSYFIQLVDFCAYAVMRMERPIPSRTALGYDTAYTLLRPAVVQAANQRDPRGLGIIR